MKTFQGTYRWVVLAVSLIFAVLFFPTVADNYGLVKSLLLTALGMAVIWIMYYFVLGSVFRHFYNQGKKEGEENNSDFI